MDILQGIILGIVQGLTEFLPVSSSGHLILFKKLFGIDQEQFGLTFDIALHFATLIAVFVVFWPDIVAILKKPVQKLTGLLIIATIPAVFVGLFLDDYIEEINVHLNESGFSLMYYGNPYDWMFLYCALSERPLDTLRGLLADVLED